MGGEHLSSCPGMGELLECANTSSPATDGAKRRSAVELADPDPRTGFRRIPRSSFEEQFRPLGFAVQQLSFGPTTSAAMRRRSQPHGHEFVELVYVYEGVLVNTIDKVVFRQQPGDLAIINYSSSHELSGETEGKHFNLYLDPSLFAYEDMLTEVRQTLLTFMAMHPSVVNRASRSRLVKVSDPDAFLGCLRRFEREQSETGPESLQMRRGIMLEMFAHISRAIRAAGERIAENDSAVAGVEVIRQYLEEHYQEQVDLAALARVAGYTPNYLCALFKREFGVTIMNYLIQYRVRRAMAMMACTDYTIATIANETGFADISNFNRQFKRITHMTPSGYLRSLRRGKPQG